MLYTAKKNYVKTAETWCHNGRKTIFIWSRIFSRSAENCNFSPHRRSTDLWELWAVVMALCFCGNCSVTRGNFPWIYEIIEIHGFPHFPMIYEIKEIRGSPHFPRNPVLCGFPHKCGLLEALSMSKCQLGNDSRAEVYIIQVRAGERRIFLNPFEEYTPLFSCCCANCLLHSLTNWPWPGHFSISADFNITTDKIFGWLTKIKS